MIVKKIIDGLKSKRVLDLKHIIIEIALIFTGITLAANYNEYQNDVQDEKFLKEIITQIYTEVLEDQKFNISSVGFQEKAIVNYQNFIKNIKEKNIVEINSDESKMTVSNMTDYLNNANNTFGYNKLKEKNLNLIRNQKLKFQLSNYYEMMDKLMSDIKIYDEDKKELKPFIFKYFKNYDYYNYNYDDFTNVDEMAKDDVFINTIYYVISDYKINIDSFKQVGIPTSKKLVTALEKEFKFLKDKNN